MADRTRWLVEIEYRAGNLVTMKAFGIDELSELDGHVENGPPFNEIAQIRITYQFGKPDLKVVA